MQKLILCLLLLSVPAAAVCAQDAASLVGLLPSEANTVAILRVADALQSPRAVQEEWAKSADERFLSGAGGIPPWVQTLVVGSRVRLSAREELWSSSMAVVSPDVTLAKLAARDGLTVESTAAGPLVQSRRGAYVTSLTGGALAVRKPAVRQEALEWFSQIADSAGAQPASSPLGPRSAYLRSVGAAPGHLVMAMDLSNTMNPDMLKQHLQLRPELAKDAARLDKVFTTLQTLRGATLTVNVTAEIPARVSLDFGSSVAAADAAVIRDFFVDLVNSSGAAIPEFAASSASANGQSVILATSLGDDSLRRIVSLITTFPAHSSIEEVAAPPQPQPPARSSNVRGDSPEEAIRKTNRKYLDAVNKLLDDLDRSNKRANSYEQSSVWHERYAKRMEELSIKNVDPALVDYSRTLAGEIRGLARSLQGEAVQVNTQQQALVYSSQYTPGWASVNIWGGVGYGEPAVNVQSNLAQVREQQAAAVAAGAQQREQIWQLMNSQRTAIDKVMRDKFGQDF